MSRRAFLAASAAAMSPVRKSGEVVVYSDDRYYSAFPSVVRLRRSGELIAAFRRAPERRRLGAKGVSHTDPNSQLVCVRSRDGGRTWSREPELICSHPLGGSQDPCLLELRDGTLLCASYLWVWCGNADRRAVPATAWLGDYAFHGGYLMRSADGGTTWQGPFTPPPVPGRQARDGYGQPLPAYNRGAMCQTRDGRVLWAVAYPKGAAADAGTDVHLMASADGGRTWEYQCGIAADERASFNETSLCETPSGDVVAFLRTAGLDDHTAVARSRDGGAVSSRGRTRDGKATRIMPCGWKTGACCSCTATATRPTASGRACSTPSVRTSPPRRRSCCARTAAGQTSAIPGPWLCRAGACLLCITSSKTTARATSPARGSSISGSPCW